MGKIKKYIYKIYVVTKIAIGLLVRQNGERIVGFVVKAPNLVQL